MDVSDNNPSDNSHQPQVSDEDPMIGRSARVVREIIETLAIALILALIIRTFILQAFYIPSSSMENTLFPNDRILVNKYMYSAKTVNRGDIIVFKSPRSPGRDFIKRCVGLQGDVVEVKNKVLYINGNPFSNPPGVKYMDSSIFTDDHPRGLRDNMPSLQVPLKGSTVALNLENISRYRKIIEEYEGHDLEITADGSILIDGKTVDSYTFAMSYYFMMGDNRDNSEDSRFWKVLPSSHVKGKAIAIYWPLKRIGCIK